MSNLRESLILPGEFEPARVPDVRFARAYARTGERGRALIKSQIAALYQVYAADNAPEISVMARLHGGQVRTQDSVSRPWHLLVIAPGAAAPAHLVAAVLPAVARRIPVLAVRISGRGGWPPALLTALELCGVEQVFSMGLSTFKSCLKVLWGAAPGGSVAALVAPAADNASGRLGRPFHERVRAVLPSGCWFHVHEPPAFLGLLDGQGIDEEALAFAHAGVPVRRLASLETLDEASGESAQVHPLAFNFTGPDAVFAPASLAPAGARVVLAPGRESVWEWPDAPAELFIARRLVYS